MEESMSATEGLVELSWDDLGLKDLGTTVHVAFRSTLRFEIGTIVAISADKETIQLTLDGGLKVQYSRPWDAETIARRAATMGLKPEELSTPKASDQPRIFAP